MRLSAYKLFIVNVIALALAVASPAQTSAKNTSASPSAGKSTAAKRHATAGKKGKHARRGAWKRKGQQVIKPERATEIQEALIREKYLTGEPTGQWDARTQAAMVRYQADNGWQSKVTPDARALIKLGLGPNYASDQMLNAAPKSTVAANTTGGSSSSAAHK